MTRIGVTVTTLTPPYHGIYRLPLLWLLLATFY
jgi:hypothetical protein